MSIGTEVQMTLSRVKEANGVRPYSGIVGKEGNVDAGGAGSRDGSRRHGEGASGFGRLKRRELHFATYSEAGETRIMSLDRSVLVFAGLMVLLSVALTAWVSPLFVWFTVFIGLNLLQSAFTGFCPAAMVFRKLGVKPGTAF